MIVAFGSGRSRLVGLSEAAFRSIEVARIVAFGSKVCGAISRPPSKVQNFWPSSGYVRLHLGQLFIYKDLVSRNQISILVHSIRASFGELLGSTGISRVKFHGALIGVNCFIFLV